MRVEVLCVGVLVATVAIGPRPAAADTHAISRRGWPGDATRWVAGLRCEPERDPVAAPASPSPAPVVVVGFTGGRERRDSRRSGVVRAGQAVAAATDRDHVTVRLYNNAEWADAVRDVSAAAARTGRARPLVVAYGHSLGAGSIGRFARALAGAGVAVDLAVYIDAFGWRNPRVPANVRQAVNFYQRTGLLRGLPLRGKRELIAESPATTTLLGNYRLTPETPRFGWNWNLIQPLLYRQHHRLAHDVRIRELLVAVAETGRHGEVCGSTAAGEPEAR
ncbi:MAG: hypothetical protein AB7U83_07570 [Vicinamibacterales bacterium]